MSSIDSDEFSVLSCTSKPEKVVLVQNDPVHKEGELAMKGCM